MATTKLMQQIESSLGQNRFNVIQPKGRAHAAIAILLEERAEGVRVLFIERSTNENDPWSGQIGFPGGRVETADNSPKDAAERRVSR
jgi:8-oxo-dGTP pyrophosphatase MutT (NUDIX family)